MIEASRMSPPPTLAIEWRARPHQGFSLTGNNARGGAQRHLPLGEHVPLLLVGVLDAAHRPRALHGAAARGHVHLERLRLQRRVQSVGGAERPAESHAQTAALMVRRARHLPATAPQ
jgi:hypothetical protein